MEKTVTAKPPGAAGYPTIWETPHYAVIKTKLPKANNENELAVFAIVDKEHGVIWGARSGIGEAKVAACIAEHNWVEGAAQAEAHKARGWVAGSNGEDSPPSEPFPSFN